MTTKTKKKIILEHFKTLDELNDTIANRPRNAAFKEEDPTSQKEENRGRVPWSGTHTYKEAMEIMYKGYKEPLEKMKSAILKIGEKDNKSKPKMKNDFVGFVPHVPNTLMNLPITMINKEKRAPKAKTIHLNYSFTAAGKTSTEDMITAGINFISLVNSLEKQGYRVRIDAIFCSMVDKTAAAYTVNLKNYNQRTNLLKLSFPLVHPAMLRRITFKWLETTPELKDKAFRRGYGTPLNYYYSNSKQETEFLKENGIIKGDNVYYCNIYQALNAKSVEDLAQRMEIIK